MEGQQIKEARQAAGISLRQMAQHLGVSHTFVRLVEEGKRRFPPSRLPEIRQLLPSVGEGVLEMPRVVPPTYHAVWKAFVQRVETRSLTPMDLAQLQTILETKNVSNVSNTFPKVETKTFPPSAKGRWGEVELRCEYDSDEG